MRCVRIKQGDAIPLKLRAGDRNLIDDLTLVDPTHIARLKPDADASALVGQFTLDELDDLLGCIAADANHTENLRFQRQLDSLCDRIRKTMERYDDGLWQDGALQQPN